MLLAVFEL